MFKILSIFFLICIFGASISGKDEFNRDYISKESTAAVNGIFTFIVFCSHFGQYSTPSYKFKIAQLMVVMFLFYSGYGIYESIKRRGTSYIKKFPKNRFLKVWLHLTCALVPYIIYNLIFNVNFTVKQTLLSTIGWESIGNSNWFMFASLAMYALVYISFMLFRKHRIPALIMTTALTVGYIFVMKEYKGAWWYNTILAFPLGMWYSFFKEKIEKLVMKNDWTLLSALIIFVVSTHFVFLRSDDQHVVYYEIASILFAITVTLFTMKVKIGNPALNWLGNHVFSVYILQRIPMATLKHFNFFANHYYIFFFTSLALTIILAELFDRLMAVIDKVLFAPKKKVKA